MKQFCNCCVNRFCADAGGTMMMTGGAPVVTTAGTAAMEASGDCLFPYQRLLVSHESERTIFSRLQ